MKYSQGQRFHPVILLSVAAAGCLVGVWSAHMLVGSWFVSPVWLVVAMVLLGLAFGLPKWWGVGLVVLAASLAGYSRGAYEMQQRLLAVPYYGQQVKVSGLVGDDSERTPSGDVVLRLDSVRVNDTSVGGIYWVTTSTQQADKVKRSDGVELHGTLLPGFATYSASMYRASLLTLKPGARVDPLLSLRDTFSDAIRRVIPDPEAALGIGYVLGQRRALPTDFEEALQIVGLTHVVVASGYNLTILVRLARRLFMKVSRYTALLAAMSLVIGFIAITGLSPSMSRAGLVAGLSLVAWYYGRTVHPVVLLLVSAAVSVLVTPSFAWGDIGWTLSFAAFGGVMFLAPLLQAYFYGDKKPGIVRQIVGETLSAQLFTLPIIIVVFGTFSNVALLANLLVLPLVPLAMLLVFVSGIASMVLGSFAFVVSTPTYWLLEYMVWVVETLSSISWASIQVQMTSMQAIGCYGILVGAVVYLRRKTGHAFAKVNLVE